MSDQSVSVVFEQPRLVAAILSHISSLKHKVRLEQTCRMFHAVIRTPDAWSRTSELRFNEFIDNEATATGCLVNEESVSYRDLPDVLALLLSRIKLRSLRLAYCNSDLVYEMVLSRICSAQILPNVQVLTLSGRGKDTYVLPFIWAFQSTLKVLHIGNCVFSARVRVVQFWRAVQQCNQLQEFCHLAYRSHVDTHSLEEDIVGALRGKPLHTLYLLALRNLSQNGITELMGSIPVGCLQRLSLSHSNVSLRMIRDHVDDEHRYSLREFRFGPFPADGTDDQLAVTIPVIFPNLVRCTLEAQALTFPSSTVVETIDRFLSHLESEGAPAPVDPITARVTAHLQRVSTESGSDEEPSSSGSVQHQRRRLSPPVRRNLLGGHSNPSKSVMLCMSIYFQHIEVLEKVLGRMVREKGCSVTPVKCCGNRYRYVITRNNATVTFYDFEPAELE